MKLIQFLAGCGSLTGIKSVISERLSRMSQCSAHPLPCDFTVLALLWGILQCLAQEGTPVKDSNHGCHLSLVGFIVHNKNALHSDSQSKGHWPKWYILSNQKRRLTFPEFSPPSKKRDLIQEPSQSKPGIYRKLLYYNLEKKNITRATVAIDQLT